ncbi:MAG: hypothetical protein R3192_16195 [Woeseiaceae bacterium]|nr:hypothetical protein [Woeseiaceae bacterium]
MTTVLLLALAASGPGFAMQSESEERPEISLPSQSVMQSDGPDLSQAVEQVRRRCNGRIVDAQTVRNGKRETHVIKCLTEDGTVRTFRIPGKRSGRV